MEALAGGMLLMMVFCSLLVLAAFVIWIWALVDAIQNPALDSTMRIVWVLVIIFTYVIGAVIYLIVAKSGVRRAPG